MFGSRRPLSGHDFTDEARVAIRAASTTAAAMGHSFVGTEHFLLALVGMAGSEAARMLVAVGVTGDEIRAAITEALGALPERDGGAGAMRRSRRPGSGDHRPLTDRAKRVLELAMEQARERGDAHVGTEHLLLALCVERGVAAYVLDALGVSVVRLQETAGATAATDGPRERAASERAPSAAAPFHVVIDDASSRSIYEQIVAQIQEGIATAALHAGDRLPTVRQLADELDVAPGTVARAYAELERTGAVITDGARGTRVAGRGAEPAPVSDRQTMLTGLLRPVAVAAYHLGATAAELELALTDATKDIFRPRE